MKPEARIFFATPTHEYRIACVLCANNEVVCNRLDLADTGNGHEDECREIVSATGRAFESSLGVTWDEDSNFQNWNGGLYSHQRYTYGWESMTGGVVRVQVSTVELDADGEDDGEREWEDVRIADLPATVREMVEGAIACACAAYTAAVNTVEACDRENYPGLHEAA